MVRINEPVNMREYGNKVKSIIPNAREELDSEIRYEMDDNEIMDFHSDKGSNWSIDLSEKELARLSNVKSVIKKLK